MRDTPKQKRSFRRSGFLRVWIVGAVAGVVTLEILALFEQLRTARIADLDALFIKLMTIHRVGAVKMADEELHGGSDIRLRVMAHAIAPRTAGRERADGLRTLVSSLDLQLRQQVPINLLVDLLKSALGWLFIRSPPQDGGAVAESAARKMIVGYFDHVFRPHRLPF